MIICIMKRFDKAIKAIQSERYRIIGKAATDYTTTGINTSYALQVADAKRMSEAIKILEEHERNKVV